MPFRSMHLSRFTWFSPWIVIGSVCLLAGILTFLAVKHFNRTKEFTERALLSQANVLMRSVEAGARAGMMGMGRGYRNQMLIEETAKQSDVLFLALVNPDGKAVAHSDPKEVGNSIPISAPGPGEIAYGFSEKGGRRFEVVRAFQPWRHQRGRGSPEACDFWGPPDQGKDLLIMAALDPAPFEEASRQDMQHTLVLFGTMLLVGVAGFTSLVWAQNFRQARSSLQDIRAFTSTVLNQMPVGLIMTDPEGRIRETNQAARLILKCPAGAGGMNIEGFPCFLEILGRLRSGGSIVGQEIHHRLNDSETTPLFVNASPIRDGEGRSTGYVFLFSDMTNIKQLEEELRRSERLAGLGKLAAGIAHEIRNPLSSIKGFALILAGRDREDDRSREIADTMVREVERLNRVVTELLDYARPTDLNLSLISCGELIQSTLRLIEKEASRQDIRIEWSIAPEDLMLKLDPDRFSQVLLNLYLNAIQAMKQGGVLTVKAFSDNGDSIIVVSDSGEGIAAENLPHVFDPYFTTKPRGVGLGLANVHKCVEAHGGKIDVRSIRGRGAQFVIRLCSTCEKSS